MLQARPTHDKNITRDVRRRLKKLRLCGRPWQWISAGIKKTGIICLHWIVSYRVQRSLWDGRSVAGAALEDQGPGGGARRWVGVQVLTGLFGHDQLVFCLAVHHRLPVAHLCKGAAAESSGHPTG